MAKMRVFSAEEWDFYANHPDIVFEGTEPVYYRVSPSVSGVHNVDRFDIYLSMDLK